jgi:hypothetical protein
MYTATDLLLNITAAIAIVLLAYKGLEVMI